MEDSAKRLVGRGWEEAPPRLQPGGLRSRGGGLLTVTPGLLGPRRQWKPDLGRYLGLVFVSLHVLNCSRTSFLGKPKGTRSWEAVGRVESLVGEGEATKVRGAGECGVRMCPRCPGERKAGLFSADTSSTTPSSRADFS